MSIRKVKDAPETYEIAYYIPVEVPGRKRKKWKLKRKWLQCSEADARVWEAEYRQQHIGNLRDIINPKIINVIPDYLAWLKLHRAEKTYKDYKASLVFILPFFGNLTVPHLTPSLLTQYKQQRADSIRAKGKAGNRSINKELDILQAIIKYMVDNNMARKLPFKVEKLPYKRPIPQIPHPAEIEEFMGEIADPTKQAMARLMQLAGLRFKEVRLLRWENLDWRKNTGMLVDTKGGTPRHFIIPEEARVILHPTRQPGGYVFLNLKTGNPYTSLKTLFNAASRRANTGQRIKPHLLRHFYLTNLLDATGDLRLVQETAGHKDIKTTQIYTHISTARLQDGHKKATDYINQRKQATKP